MKNKGSLLNYFKPEKSSADSPKTKKNKEDVVSDELVTPKQNESSTDATNYKSKRKKKTPKLFDDDSTDETKPTSSVSKLKKRSNPSSEACLSDSTPADQNTSPVKDKISKKRKIDSILNGITNDADLSINDQSAETNPTGYASDEEDFITDESGEEDDGTKKIVRVSEHVDINDKITSIEKAKAAKSEAVGSKSLFTSSNVHKSTPISGDISSPTFDPRGLDAEVLLGKGSGPNKADNKCSIRFSVVSEAFDKIEQLKGSGSGSKKHATVVLVNLYRLMLYHNPTDLIPVLYICLNKVAPDYEGKELGIGDAILTKALADLWGRSEKSIKNDLIKFEDLGVVAFNSKCQVRTLMKSPPLTCQSVFNQFVTISTLSGNTSQNRKMDCIKKLLVASNSLEAKFIVRFLQQKLRIGVQTATIYQSLAHAFVITAPKVIGSNIGSHLTSESDILKEPVSEDKDHIKENLGTCYSSADIAEFIPDVRRCTNIHPAELEKKLNTMETAVKETLSRLPNVSLIVNHLLQGADDQLLLRECDIQPGIPVQPMLAKPAKGLSEIFNRFGDQPFTAEFKYDGERCQIHKFDNTVRLFSRNTEDMSIKYPDVCKIAEKALHKISSCILDTEVVAIDAEKNTVLPFQTLQRRKKKVTVEDETMEVPVCIFAFDCLYLNGESLLLTPLNVRREKLISNIEEMKGKFTIAQYSDLNLWDDVDSFLLESINASCEGLMVKSLENGKSMYEPSKRSLNWLKLKKDYIEGLGDSVDLVPIAAFHGTGKRSGVYGAYVLAIYNSDEDKYQTACKVSTGFSDAQLQNFFSDFEPHVLPAKRSYYDVNDKLAPDVWLAETMVWECKAADISVSPVHTAACGSIHEGKGFGLRFPRFIRSREDKNPDNATNNYQIIDMYNAQFQK